PQRCQVLLDQVEALAQRHDAREPGPLDAKARFGGNTARVLRDGRHVAIAASRENPGTHATPPWERWTPRAGGLLFGKRAEVRLADGGVGEQLVAGPVLDDAPHVHDEGLAGNLEGRDD